MIKTPKKTSAERHSPPDELASHTQQPLVLSRRLFMARAALISAAAAVPSLLVPSEALATPSEAMVIDTMGGIISLVVPGKDRYSIQQGTTHASPGGVEANAHKVLVFSLNQAGAAPPPFSTFSELVAQTLNDIVAKLGVAPSGPFAAPFANLSFAKKVDVFKAMESGTIEPSLTALANNLMIYSGLLAYSEAPFLNPATGELIAEPSGWAAASYEGVSDGRSDYRGYFHGHRNVCSE